jgi:hypothetical protein
MCPVCVKTAYVLAGIVPGCEPSSSVDAIHFDGRRT